MSLPILCVDFDGVLHSYTSGWQGANIVSDPPVPGALAFLQEATRHFRVAIFSSRSNQDGGIEAMKRWLDYWASLKPPTTASDLTWLVEIDWPREKPPAKVSLDDRAITFNGKFPRMNALRGFEPWNKKPNLLAGLLS